MALSNELKEELVLCVPLIMLTNLDMRMRAAPLLVASDASSNYEAAVSAEVGEEATEVLQQLGLQKGLWSKLLRPLQALNREKSGALGVEEPELPGEQYSIHPAWQDICRGVQFEKFGKTRRIRGRRHINIGEVDAALEAEREMGRRYPGRYYIHLQDSQVALACLVKGRSASSSLNYSLRSSIPDHVSSNVRAFYGFVDSAQNPADDPTRMREVREPDRPYPTWLGGLGRHDSDRFEEMLEQHGVHPRDTTDLPEEKELLAEAFAPGRRKTEEKRIQRRQHRTAKRSSNRDESEAARIAVDSVEKVAKKDEDLLPCTSSQEEKQEEEAGRVEVEEEKSEAEEDIKKEPSKTEIADRNLEGQDRVAELLGAFRRDQFQFSKEYGSLEEAIMAKPGILELYAGCRGFSKAAVSLGACWTLSFDILHHSSEDLSSPSLQRRIVGMIRKGFFAAMGCAPVCASFSTAITPPCRSKTFPRGVPW